MRAASVRRINRGLLVALVAGLLTPTVTPALGVSTPQGAEVYRRPASGVFQFSGHGWGHGHGMSQYGAEGAATLGKTWDEIIRFYYPNTQIVAVPASEDSIRVWISSDDETDVRIVPATGLQVTDLATGATMALPATAGVDMWRATQTVDAQQLQQRIGGAWVTVPIGGVTDFAGPLEFSRPSVGWLTLALPGDKPAKFRGTIRAVRTSPSTMDTVNVLSMDDYLRGVVPHESPASFAAEALKAQAVAARTYAAYKRANAPSLTSGKYYDICDSTNCQVYDGMTGEAASSDSAVAATAGQTILYGGKPAFTEFSASNGGYSTDGGEPYLIAQPDPWDGASPNTVHSWTATVTAAQLESAFPAVGHLTAITVLSRDGHGEWGGRVLDVQLTGTDLAGNPTSVLTTGRGIFNAREWPTYRSPDGLRSTWWTITNVDARLATQSVAPVLVASPTAPEAHATLTAQFTVAGTDSFPGSALTLAAPGADPYAKAPGHFVRNVTHPGALSVVPGDVVEMAVDVDVSALAPGSYVASYRLANAGALIGDTVSWTLVVSAPVLSGAVQSVSAVSPPSSPALLPSAAKSLVVVPVAGSRTVTLAFRNTGNVSWPLDGSMVVTTGPAGTASPSADASWPAPNVPGALTGALPSDQFVRPGTSAVVQVTLAGNHVPPGSSAETFQLRSTSTGDVPGAAVTLAEQRVDPVRGLGRLPAGLSAYLDAKQHIVVAMSGVDARVQLSTLGGHGWRGLAALGDPVVGRPTSVRASGGAIVTVAHGLDGMLWWRSSAAPAWRSSGLAILDEPSAAALPDGRVEFVARATDRSLRTALWSPTAGLGKWTAVGGTFASGVAAAYGPMGLIVAAVDVKGRLTVDRYSAGHWTGWSTLAGVASDAAPVLVVEPTTGVARLFARGKDGTLLTWVRAPKGGWSAATSLGGTLLAGPGAVATARTSVQVFARFSDGRVHVLRLTPAGWKPWSLAF